MDDAFTIFESKAECDEFFNIINSPNTALKFISEKGGSESLAFLDVKICKNDN